MVVQTRSKPKAYKQTRTIYHKPSFDQGRVERANKMWDAHLEKEKARAFERMCKAVLKVRPEHYPITRVQELVDTKVPLLGRLAADHDMQMVKQALTHVRRMQAVKTVAQAPHPSETGPPPLSGLFGYSQRKRCPTSKAGGCDRQTDRQTDKETWMCHSCTPVFCSLLISCL